MGRIMQHFQIPRVVSTASDVFVNTRSKTLAVEEPLDIRINGTSFSTAMRTPGHDVELIHGLLLSTGLITHASEVSTARYCAGATGPENKNSYNVIDVDLSHHTPHRLHDTISAHTTVSSSSCCGISDCPSSKRPVTISPIAPKPRLIVKLAEKLRSQRKIFDKTGGVYAAGLATLNGEMIVVREDIDPHNAIDKAIGYVLMDGEYPLDTTIMIVSSGATFAVIQKAITAGISGVIALGPVSSLAVETARDAGVFLAGGITGDSFNHYAGGLG